MFNEINQQMEAAQEGMFRLQKINSKLGELTRQNENLKEKVTDLKLILEQEDIDLEKLEGKSLTHIFYAVLGNLDKQQEKERSEALAAQLKYDQAVRELENVNAQIYKLHSEKAEVKASEGKYKELFAKKKELLLEANSETAQRILPLEQQLGLIKNYRKEIIEAINAGSVVIHHINKAANSLDSAEGWGTWDLFGGGFLTDMVKHSHIDDAKSAVEEVQAALSRFRTELADVRITSDINIGTDGFAKFADFFFDGLIADWCMQSRIHDSQESVNDTKNQVQSVLNKLVIMDKEQEGKGSVLERELNDLIRQAK